MADAVPAVFLDTNVLLDSLLARAPWHADADRIWKACQTEELAGIVSAASLLDVWYFARKQKGNAGANSVVDACLDTFEVVPVSGNELRRALLKPDPDFEDNVQIACAERACADWIVSRDTTGFRNSGVPAVTPAELVQRLALT